MLNEATLHFVSQHTHDDVRMLALRGCKNPEVNLPLALQQIQGRQTARRKLPSWAAIDGIVYPPHLNMEQCSSEATARYKAQIVKSKSVNSKLIDLTGGFGVDFAFMSEGFDEAVYVERDEQLCAIATHNFQILGLDNVTTVCADAETVLSPLTLHSSLFSLHSSLFTLIYLDPARRDTHGAAQIVNAKFVNRKYIALADCIPNVITMMPGLLQKASHVMLKLSPMLDWRKAVADLAPHHVSDIHIVAVDNECKELLLILAPPTEDSCYPRITCADIRSRDGSCAIYTPGTYNYSPPLSGKTQRVVDFCPEMEPRAGTDSGSRCPSVTNAPWTFLYEPNAAVMKAGCFRELSEDFGIAQLSVNSHLFCSDRLIDDFPGRRFRLQAICSMNKRELKATLGHLRQANIAVRNFPLTAEQLRQRLKLADGGTDYIFATTLANDSHALLLCSKF